MKKQLLLAALVFSTAGAIAGTLDGFIVNAGFSTSSAADTVTSAAASSEDSKTLNLGVGYAIPLADGKAQVAIMGESVISIGGASTKSLGLSIQPGYYLSDEVVVYGKLGVVSEARTDDSLSGYTVGMGVKFLVAQNTYMGGEIEQVKFKQPSSGNKYNLRDTRFSAKIGYIFE